MKPLLAAAVVLSAIGSQSPSLAEILQRAGTYAVEYENRFSVLVAEERYEQRQIKQMAAPAGNLTLNPGGEARREQLRILISDYLLVRLEGGGGWMPFRDVFESDGRKIRGREERVLNLFLKPGANSLEQARRIMADSTRFNLGSVHRTINIPTLAVLLVQPDLAPRFGFDRESDETIDGRKVVVLTYKDVARPSLIRTTNGEDLALSGKLWIEPDSGTIVKTSMTVSDANVRAQTVVTFAQDKGVDFWVPSRMEEIYTSRANETITCVATYSKYRRFNVNTDEQIKKPPPH
jgi:hypothetical protein